MFLKFSILVYFDTMEYLFALTPVWLVTSAMQAQNERDYGKIVLALDYRIQINAQQQPQQQQTCVVCYHCLTWYIYRQFVGNRNQHKHWRDRKKKLDHIIRPAYKKNLYTILASFHEWSRNFEHRVKRKAITYLTMCSVVDVTFE